MKFEISEIAIWTAEVPPGYRNDGNVTKSCEVTIISGEFDGRYGLSYRCDIPGDPGPSGNGWVIETRNLRKKKLKPESKDITETREKGAPSYNEIIKQFNVEVVG